MFENIKLTGNTVKERSITEKVNGETSTYDELEGDFSQVEVSNNGDSLVAKGNITVVTIRQAAQKAVDEANIEGAAGVKISYSDGTSDVVLSENDPVLYRRVIDPETGEVRFEEAPLPEGAKVEPIYSAEGAK